MQALAGREAAVDKMEKVLVVPNVLLEATSQLTENLVQSEQILRFQEATRKLQSDKEATVLLTEFSILQQKLRGRQRSTQISEEDIKRLRVLQNAISTNEIIQEKELAEEYAIAFLHEVNQEISNILGVDFATLARRSGGCC
ncbi:MAG: YlbF family regulator [Anaerolineaceae bacterium]